MKKTFLTIAIVLGMTIGAFAQEGGGLFGKGPTHGSESYQSSYRSGSLMLPTEHGTGNDYSADTPLGSGALLLIGFGATYAMKKRKK